MFPDSLDRSLFFILEGLNSQFPALSFDLAALPSSPEELGELLLALLVLTIMETREPLVPKKGE
jgi:hypothetical protein